MTKYLLSLIFIALAISSYGQQKNNIEISEMKWGADFNIHIKFSNDSTSIYDVKALYHSSSSQGYTQNQTTYYPVSLDEEFLNSLKDRKIESFVNQKVDSMQQIAPANRNTLWSALHYDIGGGWIHFINCLVYSFESGHLNLTAPLMQRPDSDWKPSPMTESFKRTKKWKYYAPANQKLAIKEYKLKSKKNELGDIPYLPEQFTQLFINTAQKDYLLLTQNKKQHDKAIIDMVKLLVGANYFGQEQIDYISNSVTTAVLKYNVNNLPSVIIFDDFDAAVAMSLNSNGYQIDKIVFNDEAALTADEVDQRIERMEGIIHEINETNKKVFEKKLKNYYN